MCNNKTYCGVLCSSCRKKLIQSALEEKPRCSVCGKFLLSESEICTECRDNEKRVFKSAEQVFPVFSYRLWAKTLIFEWKMNENRQLSRFFADLLAAVILKRFIGTDFCIVPVPPRTGKIRKKGWDQIQEICIILNKCYGFKIYQLLSRKSKNQQKKLNREERLKNKSFELSKYGHALFIENKIPSKILLLDDVITTGATLESCSSLLKKAGVEKIQILSLFIVD